ncbi:MAG: response regulator [Calditrichaeota bacterium]|nr:response regulator [Calditrichota bacterium]MCB9368045.1 response regulator [Calditrichota bacterium]
MKSRGILVVDDDSIICEIAESILAEEGWEVRHANTTEDALKSMATMKWPVVLCDVHLPGDSGQFLQELRSSYPLTQVVMITGDPTIGTMRHAMQAGAYDYLLKPLRRDEILRVSQKALERHELILQKNELEAQNEEYRRQLEAKVDLRTDQLRISELRYRTLFDNAVDAVILLNPESGAIVELNGAAAKLIGLRSFDIHGTSIRDYVDDQLDEFLNTESHDSKVWRHPNLVLVDRERVTHILSATVSRLRTDAETLLQIVARDSSEISELSQRASLMELELMSEQRLANIGLLASGVAHNINTPLMGIYGLAQVIKMKHPDIEDIDGVIAQVERINGIIRNLMWKSRQEQERAKQDIDVNILLQEELRFLEADMEFKHNVEKEFSFSPDMPPIYGRYSDFSQSLMNIIRNALDAMYDSEVKRLTVKTDREDDDIIISIQDSGKGISPVHLAQVFQPFFTTKPAVGKSENGEPTGTGLGLSTVQKLLSPYGCKFDLDSEPGKGTTFKMIVPIAQNQPSEEDLAALEE